MVCNLYLRTVVDFAKCVETEIGPTVKAEVTATIELRGATTWGRWYYTRLCYELTLKCRM